MEKLPATLQFLPPTKKREQDPALRLMAVEILLLLSSTFTGREAMRQRGVYLAVREAHKEEKNQPIKDAIERLVSLIEGEEGRDTKQEEIEGLVKKAAPEDKEDDVVEV